MVGLSANPHRPSHFAAKYLKHAGYRITPVHPRETKILGLQCYPTLSAIPHTIEIVDIFRPSETVGPIVEEAITIGAKVVWMQFGVVNLEAARTAREAGLEVVMDACMKVEHARFFGGLRTLGLNTGVLTSRKWNALGGRKSASDETVS